MSSLAPVRTEAWTELQMLERLGAELGDIVVVTSTARAARRLVQRYHHWQQERGAAGWQTPAILAWEPWLESLWAAAILSGAVSRALLSEAQELALWEQALEQDQDGRRAFSPGTLASLARRTWRTMHRYGIPLARLRSDSSMDTQAFLRWAKAFEALCRKSRLASAAILETALARIAAAGKIPVPGRIVLLGFDRVPPAQHLLVDALLSRAADVRWIELQPAADRFCAPTILAARSADEEIRAAALWARNLLLEDPATRIAVLIPSPDAMRGRIESLFRPILAPSTMDVREINPVLPYEFSLGTPMNRLPAIRTALLLLQWLDRALPAHDVSWLLVHGGFGPAALDARARLDQRFRRREPRLGGPIPFSELRRWMARPQHPSEWSGMQNSLERFAAAGQRMHLKKDRSWMDWREAIEELLEAASWWLLAPSGSEDYQQSRRWTALLNELSSLGALRATAGFPAVLDTLGTLAARMLFALETRGAPVQILGIAESAGLTFDALWWMGADTAHWPPRGAVPPFLPWPVARQAHVPYADAAEDALFARAATRRVLHSAALRVISFAPEQDARTALSANGRERILSPLLRHELPDIPIIAAEEFLPGLAPAQSQEKPRFEEFYEEPAIPFQGTTVRGGVRFLELHAACPFRAFAELRLGTDALQESGAGLAPNVQGSILHRVLERFWSQTGSQQNLLAQTAEEHREHLRRLIGEAFEPLLTIAHEPWQRALIAIEQERMEERLLAWLEVEKQRSGFQVIETESVLEPAELGGVEFRCRIDRIDRVEAGIVLIDYKTGPVEPGSCRGERPDLPQLPVYAVLRGQAPEAGDALAGAAFASLHPRSLGFTVIGSQPGIFEPAPDKPSARWNPAALSPAALEDQRRQWHSALTQLAEEFRAGAARVDPKNPAKTCTYCEQSLLCRIRETQGASAPDDEAPQPEELP